MRPAFLARMALAAALVIAAGCSSNAGKIEGKWESTATVDNGEEVPAGARRLSFDREGHLFYTNLGKFYKGNYTLGMGPAVTFNFEEDLDGRKIHPHKIVIDGVQLTMTNADGNVLTFQKAN